MNLKEIADMSMIIGFSKFVSDNSVIKKPLRKRLNKLEKICINKLVSGSHKLTDAETELICNNMIRHAVICQWENRELPIQTYALFAADIAAYYDWPGIKSEHNWTEIQRAILDVQDYFDRQRSGIPDECYCQAIDAAEAWETIWE